MAASGGMWVKGGAGGALKGKAVFLTAGEVGGLGVGKRLAQKDPELHKAYLAHLAAGGRASDHAFHRQVREGINKAVGKKDAANAAVEGILKARGVDLATRGRRLRTEEEKRATEKANREARAERQRQLRAARKAGEEVVKQEEVRRGAADEAVKLKKWLKDLENEDYYDRELKKAFRAAAKEKDIPVEKLSKTERDRAERALDDRVLKEIDEVKARLKEIAASKPPKGESKPPVKAADKTPDKTPEKAPPKEQPKRQFKATEAHREKSKLEQEFRRLEAELSRSTNVDQNAMRKALIKKGVKARELYDWLEKHPGAEKRFDARDRKTLDRMMEIGDRLAQLRGEHGNLPEGRTRESLQQSRIQLRLQERQDRIARAEAKAKAERDRATADRVSRERTGKLPNEVQRGRGVNRQAERRLAELNAESNRILVEWMTLPKDSARRRLLDHRLDRLSEEADRVSQTLKRTERHARSGEESVRQSLNRENARQGQQRQLEQARARYNEIEQRVKQHRETLKQRERAMVNEEAKARGVAPADVPMGVLNRIALKVYNDDKVHGQLSQAMAKATERVRRLENRDRVAASRQFVGKDIQSGMRSIYDAPSLRDIFRRENIGSMRIVHGAKVFGGGEEAAARRHSIENLFSGGGGALRDTAIQKRVFLDTVKSIGGESKLDPRFGKYHSGTTEALSRMTPAERAAFYDKYTLAAATALRDFSPKLARALQREGLGSINLGLRYSTEIGPASKRGDMDSPQLGAKLSTSAGFFRPDQKSVHVSTMTGGGKQTLVHEMGHAVGGLLGWDNSPFLKQAHINFYDKKYTPYKGATKREPVMSDYTAQNGKSGRGNSGPGGLNGVKELLAESINHYMSEGKDYAKRRYGEEYVKWLETGPLSGKKYKSPR